MYSTTTASRECALARPVEAKRLEDTIDTYVWTDEYDFLRSLYDSADNTSPKFRFPDLISACVSLVFRDDNAAELIFAYLRSELVLRSPDTTRRREAMWKSQYNLLLGLQRSRANKHPYPQFQLDQFTTACVALISSPAMPSGASSIRLVRIPLSAPAERSLCPTPVEAVR